VKLPNFLLSIIKCCDALLFSSGTMLVAVLGQAFQLCWHPLLSCRTYHLWPHRGLKLQVNCCQEGNICSSWVSSLWGRQHFIWMLNAITNWLYSPLKTWNRHLHFFIGVVCKDIILLCHVIEKFQLFRYLSCTSGPSCC
jgi:hypothetical protein